MGLREAAVAGAVVLAALSLSGCGGGRAPEAPATPTSPNGEPLVGGGTCAEALGRWFDAADRNHDGFLDPTEFMADADRWFAAMDANHDGAVTPDELTALRLKLMPPKTPTRRGDEDQDDRDRRRRGGGLFSSDRPRGPNERPDPVMSADVNLDNRVTADEFRAQAERIFAGLDRDHDGRLSKDEVMVGCPAEKR